MAIQIQTTAGKVIVWHRFPLSEEQVEYWRFFAVREWQIEHDTQIRPAVEFRRAA